MLSACQFESPVEGRGLEPVPPGIYLTEPPERPMVVPTLKFRQAMRNLARMLARRDGEFTIDAIVDWHRDVPMPAPDEKLLRGVFFAGRYDGGGRMLSKRYSRLSRHYKAKVRVYRFREAAEVSDV